MRSEDVVNPRIPGTSEWVLASVFGLLLLCWQWPGLLRGGGLVGGDTYPYFFPQKQLIAQEFAAGRLPVWHDLTALGYPLLAESQGAIFYPPVQIAYRLLPVHAAYHVSFLLHYWLAYVMAWRYARSQGLRRWSALLVGLVFVYGWFPARASLEWSIIGGVWFPLCLWLTTRLLERPGILRSALLSAAFALHLLAGHFALAFITQLCCLAIPLAHALLAPSLLRSERLSIVRSGAAWCGLALLCGLLLAAVQLKPTLDLRQASQRDGALQDDTQRPIFNPAYGHLPPLYLTQLVASWWYWHAPEVVQSREMLRTPFASTADTNAVEAHLYVGLLPFALCLLTLNGGIRRQLAGHHWKVWLALSAAAAVYATGWLVPILGRLPGFGFFMGPGRYSIICQFGLALLAGTVLDTLLRRRSEYLRAIVLLLIGTLTFMDLQWSSQAVSDAVVVPSPPLHALSDSWLLRELQASDRISPVRVFAPGPNIANLFGVSSVPQYLGLGPAAYFSSQFRLVAPEAGNPAPYPAPELFAQLSRLGVTHLLTTERITQPAAQLQLVKAEPDAFLNRVWGRGSEPCYLYRVEGSAGRLQTEPADALQQVRWISRQPARIEFEVSVRSDCVLHLADLNFPGWSVEIAEPDGKSMAPQTVAPADSEDFRRSLRLPAGTYRLIWQYHVDGLLTGALTSGVTGLCLLVLVIRHMRGQSRK